MYADEDSRGGVLEPEGIVGIKFRREKQLETMARLDPTYGELRRALEDKNLSKEQLSDLKAKMAAREEQLLPVYMQIALQFADLHDRAGRMQAKNTIRQALTWKNARRFFYWRVRRRLAEEAIVKRMIAAAPTPAQSEGSGAIAQDGETAPPAKDAPRAAHLRTLYSWTPFLETELETDDRRVATWYDENDQIINERIEALKSQAVASQVSEILFANRESGLKGIQQALGMLPVDEKEAVLKYLGSN